MVQTQPQASRLKRAPTKKRWPVSIFCRTGFNVGPALAGKENKAHRKQKASRLKHAPTKKGWPVAVPCRTGFSRERMVQTQPQTSRLKRDPTKKRWPVSILCRTGFNVGPALAGKDGTNTATSIAAEARSYKEAMACFDIL